jgi:hypothetical protein
MTLRFAPERIEQWSLDRLAAYPRNPRTHSAEQVAQIAASIVEFGWTNPVLVSRDGEVIAGHGRLEAARKLGLETVPVVVLDHLTEAQRRAYVIADNKLALNAGWNEELLAAELHALNGEGFDLSLIGFDEAELDALMAPLGDASGSDESAGADDDIANEVPEPPRKSISRVGDLWHLGEHRLLCGDSTEADCIARVMHGEHAALVFTSPPYGNQRDYTRAYSNEGDIVYEPFAGSGTSLIAGERTGRKVRAIELAPEYVDVALRRWRKLFPDQPVTLDGEGSSFEAVARARGVAIPADD